MTAQPCGVGARRTLNPAGRRSRASVTPALV